MLEKYLIDHCSPTLASLKTANMFSCPYESGESLAEDVWQWNLQMKDKGLYLTILRKSEKKSAGLSVQTTETGKRSSQTGGAEVPAGVWISGRTLGRGTERTERKITYVREVPT